MNHAKEILENELLVLEEAKQEVLGSRFTSEVRDIFLNRIEEKRSEILNAIKKLEEN